MQKNTLGKAVLGIYLFVFAVIAAIIGVNVPFAIFLAYSLICFLISFKLDIKGKYFGLILFALAFTFRVACILYIKTPPQSDFKVLYNAAHSYAAGDYSFNKLNYFFDWAYQTSFVIYQGIVIKIFGTGHALVALKLLNAIYSSASCLLIYLVARNFVSDKTARFSSLLCAGLIFPLTFATVLSNQHLSTYLALLGLFIITDKKIKLNGMLRHVLAGFLIGLSNVIRPEGILIIGALLVAYLIRLIKPANEKRREIAVSFLILLAIYLGTNFMASQAVIYSGVNPAGLTNNNVLWKFVEGLNYETKGTYSPKDTEIVYENDLSNQERKELEMSMIRERLAMGPKKWVQLFINKQFFLWSDTPIFWTYGYLEDTKKSINLCGLQIPFSEVTDTLDDTHSMQMSILIILSLIGALKSFRDEINGRLLIYYLIVLFTAGIYTIIEVQTRYVYPAEFILVIPAAVGIDGIFKFIDKRKTVPEA